MIAFGSFYLLSKSKPVDFDSWGLHTKSSQASPQASLLSGNLSSLKGANLDLISDLKDRYSFSEATLGFDIRDLSFLEKENIHAIEKQLAEILPRKMRKRASQYVRPVLLLSEKHQIDPFWVMSIMWTESHFRPTAQSHVGARGLMQIMPKTKAWIYNRYRKAGNRLVVENQMTNIDFFFNKKISKSSKRFYKMKLINIELGIIYLKYLLNKFDNNHRLATVAYNMGPGWTRYRLRNKLPVGEKNLYLTKVKNAYKFLSQRI